jgi:hypothetical protein
MPDPIKYTGEQIILSSNQLLFNSRKDNIELLSKGTIHLSANKTVQIDVGPKGTTDASNIFIVNAPKIRFGVKTKGKTTEPVVKGDALEDVLNDIMDTLEEYSDMVTAAVPIYSPMLKTASSYLKLKLSSIRVDLAEEGNVKSDTTTTI